MRIHTTNATTLIGALADSLDKDPLSLENWHCLHVGHGDQSDGGIRQHILQQLKYMHKDVDCDVVQCPDSDVLFISRNVHNVQMLSIANELVNAASIEENAISDIALYDIFRDWQAVRDLLLKKSAESSRISGSFPPHAVLENASFQQAFIVAKEARASRFPLHIMLVEDDPITRRIVANSFKENYALITAGSAQEALGNYMLHAPDIVFLDIGLPDANGFDVLEQIMAQDPDAYVVMFSANSYLENVTAALTHGAAGFVPKPFKKERMAHYIEDSALHHHKRQA